jgi:Zn-dependent M16 (insulinase) family peptidase
MKYLVFFGLSILTHLVSAQSVKLTNAVVITQFDKEEDRYAMQALMADILKGYQIKALPVMNVLKQGEDPQHLLNDSVQQILVQKGFDTYLVVNVRGYDRTFKPSEDTQTLAELLETTSIYQIYRDEATSVSFEFSIYRDGKLVSRQVLRCGNVSDRDSVLKRLRKRLPKKVIPSWIS